MSKTSTIGSAASSMKRKNSIWHALPYIAPHFIIFAVFGIIPIIFGIGLAFTRWNMVGAPKFVGLQNFAKIFDPSTYFYSIFWRDLGHTLLFVLVSVPLTIMLDPKAAGTTVHQTITLDTPSLVTANPPSVRVQYTITSGRTVVSRRCKVELAGENRRQYTVEPEEVTVLVEVPEALAKSARYLGQLEVSVTPPALEPEQSKKVELRFRLPEGMTLLNPATEEVTVSRKKK